MQATSPRSSTRTPRGFTLVEMMVGSVIAFIIVAAAAELAAAMARSVKKVEDQSDLGVRMALAHGFLQGELGALAYNWNVSQGVGTASSTGSFGAGNCAPSTGVCPAGGFFPIRICRGSTVATATCDAPVATEADALMSYVPRDLVIDALRVTSQGDLGKSVFPLSGCNTFGTSPVKLQVAGTNSTAWSAGDLVLVAKSGHVTLGRLTADVAAAATSPTGGRSISVDLGPTTDTTGLAVDDGGRAGCGPRASLLAASIIRVQQVVVKLDENAASPTHGSVLYGLRNNSTAQLSFTPIISQVDDLQLRIQIARLNVTTKTGSFCSSDTSDIWTGAAMVACANEALNSDVANNVNRVIGVDLALVMRTSVETENKLQAIPYQFDRTGPAVSDKRLRRIVNIYLGLPNASL